MFQNVNFKTFFSAVIKFISFLFIYLEKKFHEIFKFNIIYIC